MTIKVVPFPDYGHDLVATALALIGIFGFTLNFFTIFLIIKNKNLRTPMNVLFLNLSVGDLMVSTFGNPFSFASSVRRHWLWGEGGCVWYGFANFIFGVVSIVTLSVISFERYLVVVRPFNMGHLTFKHVFISSAFIWTYSLAWTAPPLFGWSSYVQEGPGTGCSVAWEERDISTTTYVVTIFITCMLLPLAVILFSYSQVIGTIRKAAAGQAGETSSAAKAEGKVARMVVVMVTCYVIAWTPYSVVALYGTFSTAHVTPAVAVLPSLFAKSSTAYNPIIYVAMNKKFRTAFILLVCCGRNPLKKPEVIEEDMSYNATVGRSGKIESAMKDTVENAMHAKPAPVTQTQVLPATSTSGNKVGPSTSGIEKETEKEASSHSTPSALQKAKVGATVTPVTT